MRLTVIVFMMLAASLASADPQITATGETGFGSGQYEWEPLREVVLKWSQLPDTEGGGISSEDWLFHPYWSEAADDFYCEDGNPVVAIEWWGIDWVALGITNFVIRFYTDVPAPPFSHPGDLLYEEMIYSWTEEYLPGTDDYYHYSVDLPVAFDQIGGNVYWISIQGVHEGLDQWYWLECLESDYWNDEGTWRNEYFGYPDWIPISQLVDYYEFSFALYADVTSPVEDASWGSIKAMFR